MLISKKIGNFLIYLSLSLTTVLWLLSKSSFTEITSWPFLAVSQITALLGTILFVWSMFLATRLGFLEDWFGGLDKVYKIHRRVSITGAILILIHPISLLFGSTTEWWRYFLPFHSQNAVNLGILAFWVFVIVIFTTLFIRQLRIPYHIWKRIHKFINLAMFLSLLHIVIIKSDTSMFLPLGIWIYWMTGFGLACGLYISFFYRFFGPKYKYEVIAIERQADIHNVYLKPLAAKIPFALAQFAYVSFRSKKVSSELHPYCIASLPKDEILRFSIKELGDYTRTLGKLKVGDKAMVYGPYGRLADKFTSADKDAVFIAGGIGIAPFLSMFKEASLETSDRKISLFYCTQYKKDATFDLELKELKKGNSKLHYHNQCSRGPGGCRLSIEQIMQEIRDIENTIVYLCGPKRMMDGIKKELVKKDFHSENIILEDFEML